MYIDQDEREKINKPRREECGKQSVQNHICITFVTPYTEEGTM